MEKKFKFIIFDWDGTAVENRQADASLVTQKLTELLNLGVYIAVITGTHIGNIEKQFLSLLDDEVLKQNLYICTNRGSEVYGFDENLKFKLFYQIKATEEENLMLNKVVEHAKNMIQNTSKAEVQIIYDRMNRRKLDLIPEWSNPEKNEIDKLLVATQKRLDDLGFAGGIQKAYNLMINLAMTSGFGRAKITSDVKHIEIGLTDKYSSIMWLMKNVAKSNSINDDQILIIGDEFGEIAGFQGSDYKMVLKNHPAITYISVGIEPNGVPSEILHLGGGPTRFIELLEKQIIMLSFN